MTRGLINRDADLADSLLTASSQVRLLAVGMTLGRVMEMRRDVQGLVNGRKSDRFATACA